MTCTLDLSDEELDYLFRLLSAHIDTTTKAIRALDTAQPTTDVQRMHDDVRVAATLAGRLPCRSIRTE